MVKTPKTLRDLTSFLTKGAKRHMALKWLSFLESANERSRELMRGGGGVERLNKEQRLLIEEESTVRNEIFHGNGNNESWGERIKRTMSNAKTKKEAQQKKKRKKKMELERERAQSGLSTTMEAMTEALSGSSEEEEEEDLTSSGSGEEEEEGINLATMGDTNSSYSISKNSTSNTAIRTYSSESPSAWYLFLLSKKPTEVVLYDPDPAFVRTLECYANAMGGVTRISVFFLLYQNSVEEKQYKFTLQQEVRE